MLRVFLVRWPTLLWPKCSQGQLRTRRREPYRQSLALEQEFAQQTYLTAKAARDAALAEAQRQSRYLGGYIQPTLAQTAEYPRRAVLISVIGIFLLISWGILVMVYYSLRDRR